MENNIPFGFEDNGEPAITMIAGTTKGCERYLKYLEAKREAEKNDYKEKLSLPSTPEAANYWFIQQRRKNDSLL